MTVEITGVTNIGVCVGGIATITRLPATDSCSSNDAGEVDDSEMRLLADGVVTAVAIGCLVAHNVTGDSGVGAQKG